jgi:protein-tyrosine phosphatase
VGAPGARDLGGLPTTDHRRVRPGVLFRAPALGRLTDDDVAALGALGLAEVIDLRFGQEILEAPPDRLPAGPHLAHIPIHDPEQPVFAFLAGVLAGEQTPEADQLRREGTGTAMLAVYRAFVSAPMVRSGFATAARRVVDLGGRPALYHCSVGKDRTGWLTAILLAALGVDRATITADYLRTNTERADLTDKLVARAQESRGIEPTLLRPVLAAEPAYLDAAYERVDAEFGSFHGYLTGGLGLTDADLDRLRDSLLELE